MPEQLAGARLDQVIAALTDFSRGAARRLIARGSVFVAGRRVKVAGRRVSEGADIVVHASPLAEAPSTADTVPPIDVVYESEAVVVVDKPSGVFSAPTPETDRNDLLFFLRERYGTLHLVHRLDRPTSGVLLLARSSTAAAQLTRELVEHRIQRRYEAILAGCLAAAGQHVTISDPLGGKPAVTHFEVLQATTTATRVRARLETGRTHQIRLHAAGRGHPVAGDSKYGRPQQRALPRRAPRLCLHADELTFEDPVTRELVDVRIPRPQVLIDYWNDLRLHEHRDDGPETGP